jgi:hypothetical protein
MLDNSMMHYIYIYIYIPMNNWYSYTWHMIPQEEISSKQPKTQWPKTSKQTNKQKTKTFYFWLHFLYRSRSALLSLIPSLWVIQERHIWYVASCCDRDEIVKGLTSAIKSQKEFLPPTTENCHTTFLPCNQGSQIAISGKMHVLEVP